MDRKGILILLLSFSLLMLWGPLVNKIYPPIPAPPTTNETADVTGPTAGGGGTNRISAPTPDGATVSLPTERLVDAAAEETLAELENEQLKLTFTSHGGGLQLVQLKHHFETVTCRNGGENSDKDRVTLNTKAPVPILAVLGGAAVQGDGLFTLTTAATRVRAEKLLENGLAIAKTFQFESNYLVRAVVTLTNTSSEPLALPAQQWITGTATPINLKDDGLYMGVYWSDGRKATEVGPGWFANKFLCFPGTPRHVYFGGASNLVWTAVHNQFFTIAAMARETADGVTIVQTNLPPPTREELVANPKAVVQPVGYLTGLDYAGQTLAPGAGLAREFLLYAGPKEYNALARLGEREENNLDLLMGYSGFFGFFAKVLLLSMNGLYALGLSYGMAIVVITIIIKTLFWPLTTASTRSMKRMAALQPQMKALQERFKDDPKRMNQKMMEFWKEHKVNPLGGCLPMLLQIPVFFGFFQMIRSATELRGARFLWACDLSKADTIFSIPLPVMDGGFPVNPMPIIMGLTMLWQARLTPPAPGMDPMQQKMMRYLPLMFLFILYNFSAGLTLYWTVQNLLTIAQTKLTRTTVEPAAAQAVQSVPVQRPISMSKKKRKRK